jgi:two-component system chemotaxis response regulator CheY
MALNVLIVDDSAVMRAMIRRTLEIGGLPVASVLEAANGREALDLLQDHWIDLALLDVNMPVMNGEAFLTAVRHDPLTRDLAVVVVSTESSDTRIRRLQDAGASFVHKPFTPEELRDVIVDLTGVSHGAGTGLGAATGGGYDF